MPMTVDQIVQEALTLPREQMEELIDRLAGARHETDQPKIDEAWRKETRRRLAEIESGSVQAIPADEVTARVRVCGCIRGLVR